VTGDSPEINSLITIAPAHPAQGASDPVSSGSLSAADASMATNVAA
jgi:hypothetical protein